MKFKKLMFLSLFFLSLTSFSKPISKGDTFPDLSEFELSGNIPEIKGKVVLIDFWASWCAPCKRSFPALESIYNSYKEQGFEIIAINLDEDKNNMTSFLDSMNVSFPILHDTKQQLVAFLKIKSMPTSFIIDRKGKIFSIHNGFSSKETPTIYENDVKELLK